MFCSNCGKENEEGAKFCAYCGTALNGKLPVPKASEESLVTEEESQSQVTDEKPESAEVSELSARRPKKKKTWVFVVAAIIVLAVSVGAVGILAFRNIQEKQHYEDSVASGNRYLEEMDYEKAEAFYLDAISIDPKQKEPYLQLSDMYLTENRVEDAKAIVHKAVEQTASEYQSEFEKLEEEWKNLEEYTWSEVREIDAYDIFYLRGRDNFAYSQNELKKQMRSQYAVIQQGDSYGLIDMEGKLLEGMDYSKVGTILNYYNMTTKEPRYVDEYEMEMTDFYLTDRGIQPAVAVFGDVYGMQGTYYYCGEIKNTVTSGFADAGFREGWNLNPLENAIPVKETDESMEDAIIGGRANAFEEAVWLSDIPSKYAIWKNNTLLTDFIYDECGSVSSGLLAVEKDGKWGYINEQGQEVIPIEYDASWNQYIPAESTEAQPYCYAASDGYVALVKNGQWELRNTEGDLVIATGVFEAIRPVYAGKCWARKDGKWGVINLSVSGEDVQEKDWQENIQEEGKNMEESEDTEKEIREVICGSWHNETEIEDWVGGEYITEFHEDGTVVCTGYRERDTGTYQVIGENIIEAVFDENYFLGAGTEAEFQEGYTYSVRYQYDGKSDTLYAEYSMEFEEAGNSIGNGSGTLYRMN